MTKTSSDVVYPDRVGEWRLEDSTQASERPGGHWRLDDGRDERILVTIHNPTLPSYTIDDWPVRVHDLGEHRLTLGYFPTETEAVAGAVEYMSMNVPDWAGSQSTSVDDQQRTLADGGLMSGGEQL